MRISRAVQVMAVMAVMTVGAAVLLVGSPEARAQVEDVDRALRGGAGSADQRISLDVQNQDIREVAEIIQAAVGVNIYVDTNVHAENITLHLTDIPWRQALELLARQAEVEVVERTSRLFILTQPPRVSMEFTDADIRVVLDILARQSGQNIVISPSVTGSVTLNLRNVDWREALETIAATVGAQVVREGDRLLRVAPREEISQETFVEVIPLRYIQPPSPYRAVAAGSGGGGAEGAGVGGGGTFFIGEPDVPEDPVEAFGLFTALRDVLQQESGEGAGAGYIRYNIETNSFIIRGTRPQIEQIRTIIDTVDVEPEQVFVDLKFITTTASDLEKLGTEWDDFGQVGPQGLQAGASAGSFNFDIGEGVDLFEDQFSVPGVLNFSRSSALVQALEQFEDTKVTQAPTLMTLNDAEATIFVGENVPYAAQDVQVDQNGNLTVSIEEGDDSPVSVGFSLFVSPHIVPDSDQIIMTIIPRVTDLVGQTSPLQGFERFEFVDPVTGVASSIDLPRTADQTMVTRLMVQSGSTAVIGGLVTERLLERTTEVPILAEIPVVGDLFFRFRERENILQNLLIFVTPRIVRFGEGDRGQRITAGELFERYYRIQEQHDPFELGNTWMRRPGTHGRHAREYDGIPAEEEAPGSGDGSGAVGDRPAAPRTPSPTFSQPGDRPAEGPTRRPAVQPDPDAGDQDGAEDGAEEGESEEAENGDEGPPPPPGEEPALEPDVAPPPPGDDAEGE